MTINFGDLRKGVAIEVDGQPYEVLDYQRHKMQQRAPVTRLKLRNLKDGKVMERTFQSYTTEFALAPIEERPAQFLYSDGSFYNFMDMESFDQYQLTKEQLGEVIDYLKEEDHRRCDVLQRQRNQCPPAHFRRARGGRNAARIQRRYGPGRYQTRKVGNGADGTGPSVSSTTEIS